MAKSIRAIKKSRGRPKGDGTGTLIGARWPDTILKAIDDWRRRQDDLPGRAEAIRRLVAKALGMNR